MGGWRKIIRPKKKKAPQIFATDAYEMSQQALLKQNDELLNKMKQESKDAIVQAIARGDFHTIVYLQYDPSGVMYTALIDYLDSLGYKVIKYKTDGLRISWQHIKHLTYKGQD